MLPILTNFTPAGSKDIEIFWQPSPYIQCINISQFTGTLAMGFYVGFGGRTTQVCTWYDMEWLNKTGSGGISHCAPNTVYQVCFQSQWRPQDHFDCLTADVLFRRTTLPFYKRYSRFWF